MTKAQEYVQAAVVRGKSNIEIGDIALASEPKTKGKQLSVFRNTKKISIKI